MDKKIKRNIAQCLVCGDIIESKSVHDFVKCKCGKMFLDGGKDYVRFGAEKLKLVKLMTEYEDNLLDCCKN